PSLPRPPRLPLSPYTTLFRSGCSSRRKSGIAAGSEFTEFRRVARKIIIDTDPGQDDAIAILLALASPKELEILGLVAVAGNVGLDRKSTRLNSSHANSSYAVF